LEENTLCLAQDLFDRALTHDRQAGGELHRLSEAAQHPPGIIAVFGYG
jgi:hypothetical protein